MKSAAILPIFKQRRLRIVLVCLLNFLALAEIPGYACPFAGGGCCRWSFNHCKNDLAIITEWGTAFDLGDGIKISLIQGRMVLLSGKKSIRVTTPLGNFTIPEHSAVLASINNPYGSVENLDASAISINIGGSNEIVNAVMGEEICFSNVIGISKEELVPVDGVDRLEIDSEENSSYRWTKNRFDLRQMFYQGKRLRGGFVYMPGPGAGLRHVQRRVQALKDKLEKLSREQILSTNTDSGNTCEESADIMLIKHCANLRE